MALTLQNPLIILLLPVLWLLIIAFAWPRRFKPFGAFILRLLIVLFIGIALSQPVILPKTVGSNEPNQKVVILLDRSASMLEKNQHIFQTELTRLLQQFPDAAILYFADQPAQIPITALTSPQGSNMVEIPLDPEQSNLAKALSTGAKMIAGQQGRIILLSDGLSTTGDIEASIAQLKKQNIPVDTLILNQGETSKNELRMVKLDVPPILRKGEKFTIEAIIHTILPTKINLTLTQNDFILAEDIISLEPGFNLFTFEATANKVGSYNFKANIDAPPMDDKQSINNNLSAFSQVYAAPQILLVGEDSSQLTNFAAYLKEAGFVPLSIHPAGLPSNLSELESFAGMVFLDVSARSLELEQMIAVQEFVRSFGRGLLVTGGRNSFSLGDYKDTPLSDIIPLSLEPPPRGKRPPVALLLIIDHSGSMLQRHGKVTKMAMAKEAAIRATDILGPEDLIGVLVFDNKYKWVVPFQAVSDGVALLKIQRDIASIDSGGGTRVLKALQIGLPALLEQKTNISARHAILFSDGKSFDKGKTVKDYDRLIDTVKKERITLSTIAIGNDADKELLAHLAERGLGRFHFAATPEELPALTVAESDILRSNIVQTDDYKPAVSAPHPILRGFFNDTNNKTNCPKTGCLQKSNNLNIPNLTGYLAMTPKPRSETALQIGAGDPLLAVWGYGLGRVAAWSSDTGYDWTGSWTSWSEASRFWGQVVGYTLPSGAGMGLVQLKAEFESNDIVTLTADSLTATGQTVDLAPTKAILTTPGGQELPLTLRQVSPGLYRQRLKLADRGAYKLTVIQTRDGGEETAMMGFVAPYPPEYGLQDEEIGRETLTRIAVAGGGRRFSPGELLYNPDCNSQLEDCKSDRPKQSLSTTKTVELWPYPLWLALFLWPVEIAWRRFGKGRIQ